MKREFVKNTKISRNCVSFNQKRESNFLLHRRNPYIERQEFLENTRKQNFQLEGDCYKDDELNCPVCDSLISQDCSCGFKSKIPLIEVHSILYDLQQTHSQIQCTFDHSIGTIVFCAECNDVVYTIQ